MEQTMAKSGRRAGWSEKESNLLWETADEAHKQGLPLKSVFERIAERTGRRPNSIRNYYYAQVRKEKGDSEITSRFVPFTEDEVEWLILEVLKGRAEGMSVRACLQKLSGGDHSLTLRYQNKYRAVLKNRPDYVREMVEKLNGEGIRCTTPEVNHRTRESAQSAMEKMNESAYRSGDHEIVRACETITALMDSARREERFVSPKLVSAAASLVKPLKDFLCLPDADKEKELNRFSCEIASLLGALEEYLPPETV
ncbi:MAG: hypothetical protein IJC48_02425 [Clostridia bacterium]|nr:hypothetical protein [Clostridia bacterium]